MSNEFVKRFEELVIERRELEFKIEMYIQDIESLNENIAEFRENTFEMADQSDKDKLTIKELEEALSKEKSNNYNLSQQVRKLTDRNSELLNQLSDAQHRLDS